MKNIEEIKEKIIKENKCIGIMIDYAELQRLHKRYFEQLTEKDFAIEVLELSYTQYRHMKNQGQKGKIFYNLGNKRIGKVSSILLTEGYDKIKINYKTLKQIHEQFADDLSEEFFATKCLGLHFRTRIYIT